jgi:hypothetical protein
VKVKAGSGTWTYRRKYTLVRPNEERISPKWVRRGLIEFSTMSNGCTYIMIQYCLFAERRIARGEEIGYTQVQDPSSEQVAVNGAPRA